MASINGRQGCAGSVTEYQRPHRALTSSVEKTLAEVQKLVRRLDGNFNPMAEEIKAAAKEAKLM